MLAATARAPRLSLRACAKRLMCYAGPGACAGSGCGTRVCSEHEPRLVLLAMLVMRASLYSDAGLRTKGRLSVGVTGVLGDSSTKIYCMQQAAPLAQLWPRDPMLPADVRS